MDKFKITYDKIVIENSVRELLSFEERIEYLEYLLSEYYKIYDHESDSDVSAYLLTNNIHKSVEKVQSYFNNSWDNPEYVNDKIICFKFFSKKYIDFISEMLQLIVFVEYKLNLYKHLLKIISAEDSLIFDKSVLINKLFEFDDIEEKYNWLNNYYELLFDIVLFNDDLLFTFLYDKYNLEISFPVSTEKKLILRSKYNLFSDYISNDLIPFARMQISNIVLLLKTKDALRKYPDGFLNEDDKYPCFDFDYIRIQTYSKKVFKTKEEKIEYFIHVINNYENIIGLNYSISVNANKCVSQLRKEIENYKEIINISDNNKTTNPISVSIDSTAILNGIQEIMKQSEILEKPGKAKLLIPKNKLHPKLIKQYIFVAEQVNDIPQIKDLASELLSESSWSKKLKSDIIFLADLGLTLEKKLRRKNINNVKFALFVKLKVDIEDKLKKAQKEETKKTGQTNTKVKQLNVEVDLFEGDDDYTRLRGG